MNQLSKQQKRQLFQFCEQNQDAGWDYIARWATQTFGVNITAGEVAQLYMAALLG